MAVHKLIIAEKDTTLPMRQVIFIVSVSTKIMDIRNGI